MCGPDGTGTVADAERGAEADKDDVDDSIFISPESKGTTAISSWPRTVYILRLSAGEGFKDPVS